MSKDIKTVTLRRGDGDSVDDDCKTVVVCINALNRITDEGAIRQAIRLIDFQLSTWRRMGRCAPLKVNRGDRFTVTLGNMVVLMEARDIYCADVWNCYPVHAGGKFVNGRDGCMIFTDDDLARKCKTYRQLSGCSYE